MHYASAALLNNPNILNSSDAFVPYLSEFFFIDPSDVGAV